MPRLRFTIPGKPQPQERPMVLRRGWTIDRPKSRNAKKMVGFLALEAMGKTGVSTLACPVSLKLTFYGLRPNADLSNAQKLVEDALNKVVYVDDKQIFKVEASRELCTKGEERTEVELVWFDDNK